MTTNFRISGAAPVELDWQSMSLGGLDCLGSPKGAAFVFLMEDVRPKFLQSRSRVVTEYIAGRLIGAADVRMEKDQHGRPSLAGVGLYVSISHSGPCMAVVLATEEVGVDIERIRNQGTWPDLYRWINRAEDCLPAPTAREFLSCWTAKESILKMLGGFDYGVQRISVPALRSNAWCRVLVDERSFYLRSLPQWKGMNATIALTAPVPVLPFFLATSFPDRVCDRK